ncbi:hypothetical protein J6590_031717 [Homalodisca vitripennis]|nr:hypothetical protein J6590_031717 [Homalodisca vitripennis]
MASAIVTFFAVLMVSAYGDGVDSAHMQCDLDHQCPDGFFCYEESHYCTRCLDCGSYKRKASWRSCPKTPTDCGTCITGFEEEILHEGRTRDMCIPSIIPNTLSHTNASTYNTERYIWGGVVTVLLVPIMFYVFCRKTIRRDGGVNHHGIPHEEPPPYRSIELTTLTSNNSEERLSEENHVLMVGQQKDCLVQAVPFRQPDYAEELMLFDNSQEATSDVESTVEGVVLASPNIELHDENTMPSDWTPAEQDGNGQLMTLETPEIEVVSEPEDTCEPASKRQKTSPTHEDSDASNTQYNINLIINNNVTIHKPS